MKSIHPILVNWLSKSLKPWLFCLQYLGILTSPYPISRIVKVSPKQFTIAAVKSGISYFFKLPFSKKNTNNARYMNIATKYILRLIIMLCLAFCIILNSPLSSYSWMKGKIMNDKTNCITNTICQNYSNIPFTFWSPYFE